MSAEQTPTVPVPLERPWRLACSRTVDGVRTFVHECHATRAEALLALDLYACTGEWDAIVLTPHRAPAAHEQGVATRHILAVGGRLGRPLAEEA